MRGPFYTIAFVLVLALVASTVLTGVNRMLRERIAENQRPDELRAILTALGVPPDPRLSPAELAELFAHEVQETLVEGRKVCRLIEGGRVSAVAVQVSGPGYLSHIEGYLGLKRDLKTIIGLAFYEQAETPGLGGEIANPSFSQRFVGRRIVDAEGRLGLRITKPRENKPRNEADAITGATRTSQAVEEMLNKAIEAIAGRQDLL